MAMLISRFHRLIQSRILWAFFLLVIVITFVFWGMQPTGCQRHSAENAPGMLDGKPVSPEEFQNARIGTYRALCLMLGRPVPLDAGLSARIQTAAWHRLAALRQAHTLGMVPSEAEVRDAIRSEPSFMENNQFSPARYRSFIQSLAQNLSISPAEFEAHIREEMAMQNMERVIRQSAFVVPAELRRAFSSVADTFTVLHVVVSNEDVAASVKVEREDAERFFLAHTNRYRLPDRITVRYVEFPYSDYAADSAATEEESQEYYNERMDDFTELVAVTNETPAATNEPSSRLQRTTLPYEKVRDKIMTLVAEEKAREKALDVATQMVLTLEPDREGHAPTFEEAAAKFGRTIKSVGPFARHEPVSSVSAGPAFNEAAFRLTQRLEERFSDPVSGNEAALVLYLAERHPSHVPPFDDVAERALADAREEAVEQAMRERAGAVRQAAVEGLRQGRSFADSVKSFGLTPITTDNLTAISSDTNMYENVLLPVVVQLNEGEVSEPVPAEGALWLCYVAQRTSGNLNLFDQLRRHILDNIKATRVRFLFQEWQDSLLREGKFVDRLAQSSDLDEEGETGGGAEGIDDEPDEE